MGEGMSTLSVMRVPRESGGSLALEQASQEAATAAAG